MRVYDSKITVSKKSRNLVEAECNFIRKFMEQNLELGKSHRDIMNELQISEATYYRHVKRIMDEDAKIWDKVHMDSAKYRSQRLIDDLLNCVNLCKQIMNNPNEKPADRIEAAKTLCISEAQIYKIVECGPTFKPTLPIYPKNNNPELTDNSNDDSTKQLPN